MEAVPALEASTSTSGERRDALVDYTVRIAAPEVELAC